MLGEPREGRVRHLGHELRRARAQADDADGVALGDACRAIGRSRRRCSKVPRRTSGWLLMSPYRLKGCSVCGGVPRAWYMMGSSPVASICERTSPPMPQVLMRCPFRRTSSSDHRALLWFLPGVLCPWEPARLRGVGSSPAAVGRPGTAPPDAASWSPESPGRRAAATGSVAPPSTPEPGRPGSAEPAPLTGISGSPGRAARAWPGRCGVGRSTPGGAADARQGVLPQPVLLDLAGRGHREAVDDEDPARDLEGRDVLDEVALELVDRDRDTRHEAHEGDDLLTQSGRTARPRPARRRRPDDGDRRPRPRPGRCSRRHG